MRDIKHDVLAHRCVAWISLISVPQRANNWYCFLPTQRTLLGLAQQYDWHMPYLSHRKCRWQWKKATVRLHALPAPWHKALPKFLAGLQCLDGRIWLLSESSIVDQNQQTGLFHNLEATDISQ